MQVSIWVFEAWSQVLAMGMLVRRRMGSVKFRGGRPSSGAQAPMTSTRWVRVFPVDCVQDVVNCTRVNQ